MRSVYYIFLGVLAFTVGVASFLFIAGDWNLPWSERVGSEKSGGAFSLVRHDGTPINDRDLSDKPYAIFFGFSHCPDICPTTLFEMSSWINELGEDSKHMGFYFMTVDPERDSPEFLGEYLSLFNPQIVGITGEKSKVEKTLAAFRVYSRKTPLEDDEYTMDHTASVYLIDAKGEFRGTIAYGEDTQSAIGKLRKILNNR